MGNDEQIKIEQRLAGLKVKHPDYTFIAFKSDTLARDVFLSRRGKR